MTVRIFLPMIAVEPTTMQLVANAAGQIYAVNDNDLLTPLECTDLSGQPLAEILTGPTGVTPTFMADVPDDRIVVKWVSGEHVLPISSVEGLYDELVAAKAAAESAASTATAAVANAILSLVAGSNITITGDPKNPTISATGGGGGGGAVDSVNGQTGEVVLEAAQVGAIPEGAGMDAIAGLADALGLKASLVHSHLASQITDMSSLGRQIAQAATAEAVRALIGAGTGSGTASWTTLADKPSVIAAGANAVEARAAIGAGTGSSNLQLGTSSGTALAGDGTAAAATKLATARNINGHSFDGTAGFNITKSDIGLGNVENVAVSDAVQPLVVAVQWDSVNETWGDYDEDPTKVRMFLSQWDPAATAPIAYNKGDAWHGAPA